MTAYIAIPRTASFILMTSIGFHFQPGATSLAQVPQEEESDRSPEPPPPALKRRTAPSNKYIDPASFFRLHGYATIGFAAPQTGLGADPLRTPHILVNGISPRTGRNEGGFLHDSALFVGAEPFDGVSATIEIHFVGTGLDPVLTEAKATWDFLTPEDTGFLAARLHGGRFWWPFGVHNGEWFSAVNRFSLISVAAAEVVPAHFNEVGVMLESEVALSDQVGLNAVVSVGNGVPGFELEDAITQTPFDYDGDPTVTGRVALYYLRAPVILEVGVSGAYGGLRQGPDTDRFPLEDARAFGADFAAVGGDLTLELSGFEVRAYYYASREHLEDAREESLNRHGLTAEVGYRFDIGQRFLQAIGVAARGSFAEEEFLLGGAGFWLQYGPAAYINVTRSLTVRASYLVQTESGDARADNNDVFGASATAEF